MYSAWSKLPPEKYKGLFESLLATTVIIKETQGEKRKRIRRELPSSFLRTNWLHRNCREKLLHDFFFSLGFVGRAVTRPANSSTSAKTNLRHCTKSPLSVNFSLVKSCTAKLPGRNSSTSLSYKSTSRLRVIGQCQTSIITLVCFFGHWYPCESTHTTVNTVFS